MIGAGQARLVSRFLEDRNGGLGDFPEATLVVSRAYLDEGPTLKRFQPRAQGRAFRINKRTSHITIEVESVERAPRATGKKGNK